MLKTEASDLGGTQAAGSKAPPREFSVSAVWRSGSHGKIRLIMTKAQLQEQILALPIGERLDVADAIWESLEGSIEPMLPAWQRQLLDERIAVAEADPDAGTPWSEVKEQALKSL